MKFIKIKTSIISVAEIKWIYINEQHLYVEISNKTLQYDYSSMTEATEELNRIYKQLE